MTIMAILQLAPQVLAVVEVVKRFLPDRTRTVANPIIALATGLLGAYAYGGQQEVMDVLMTGVTAAIVAIATYKIPKEIGKNLNIK